MDIIDILIRCMPAVLILIAVVGAIVGYVAWRNERRRQDEAAELVRQAEAIAKAARSRSDGSGGGGGTIEPA